MNDSMLVDTYERHSHFNRGRFIEGATLRIYYDDDPLNPRTEWDNLGHMICAHKGYELGDEQVDTYSYDSWDEIAEMLESERGAVIILPLYLMDHSGLSMSVGSSRFRACDSVGWDWGQVGFIYVTFDEVTKEFGDTMPESMEKAERILCGEVDTYDKYLSGQTYGFVLETEDGEEVDSCWGFYDIDSILDHTGFNHD